MSDNTGSKISFFLVGLGIGALVGILFAPKSGEETREYLSQKADEGREYAQRKAKELRERAEDLVERGKSAAARQKEINDRATVVATTTFAVVPRLISEGIPFPLRSWIQTVS